MIRVWMVLVFLAILSASVKAQTVYKKQDYAKAGRNFVVGTIQINRDTLQLDSVSNATFNFSNYPYERVDTIFFRSPSVYKTSDYFPDAELAIAKSSQYTHMLQMRSDTLWQVGFLGDYLNINANTVLPFKKHEVFQVFPVDLSVNYSQTIERDIKTPYHFREGIDSVRKIFNTTRKVKVLGEGSIETPYGEYGGMLQQTTVRRTCRGYTFSSFGWTPSRKMRCDEHFTRYQWFDPDYGYPVGTIVTNERGFVKRMEYLLELPVKLSVRKKHVTCHNGKDGGLLINARGGVPRYTYQWDDGAEGAFRRDLPAGEYAVKITDNWGHTKDTSLTLTQPQKPLSVDAKARHERCYNSLNGRLVAHVENGKPPVEYLWSNGGRTDTLKQVRPGRYWVQVTDSKGCKASDTVRVKGAKAPLQVQLFAEDSPCKGEPGGEIKTTVRGGVKPYTFLWNNGDTTKHLKDVPAGQYRLTVTDAPGCTATAEVTVEEPEEKLVMELKKQHVTCDGLRNGSASITVRGGSPGYNVRWFNGSSGSEVDQLRAGHYSVQVTDRIGCRKREHFSINEPDPLQVLVHRDKPLSPIGNGALSACVSGGTPPYDLKWSNSGGGFRQEGLKQGTYRVKVTDSYNCQTSKTVQLKALPLFGYTFNKLDSIARNRGFRNLYVRLYDARGLQVINYASYDAFVKIRPELPPGLYMLQLWKPGKGIVFKGHVQNGGGGRP